MRLYLLPLSSRRTLLYCQKLNVVTTEKQSWMDKIQGRSAKIWASWEKKDKGWQKKVVNYGNYAFRRISYEEWGLKSVPPLSKRREGDELEGKDRVEVVYPESLMPLDRVPRILHKLATERESLHRKRMIWCFVGMPFTAPVALVPLIPNLPFFYLVYRAWSHWRALSGGKHVQFLLQHKLLSFTPSPIVDAVYAKQKTPLASTLEPTTDTAADEANAPETGSPEPKGEVMLLSQANGKKMAQALDIPELEVELDRAIWQVEMAIKKQNAELASKKGGEGNEGSPNSGDTTASENEKKTQ